VLNDIVMKAMSPDIPNRYQRASDVLDDVLAVRKRGVRRTPSAVESEHGEVQEIQTRLRARETPQPRFCWHCRKPLHARSDHCPFCGEAQ
jgi:hypothetical protein